MTNDERYAAWVQFVQLVETLREAGYGVFRQGQRLRIASNSPRPPSDELRDRIADTPVEVFELASNGECLTLTIDSLQDAEFAGATAAFGSLQC
jgi:hypothetical protein